jgi:hypothetical protein
MSAPHQTNEAARFDADYYATHYDSSHVHDQGRLDSLVNGILGMAAWWKVPVRSVLDVGAGTGGIGRALRRHHPGVRYRGTEISKHACATYGHQHVDIARWSPSRAYDLTICLSVLQCLDDLACEAAISNLGRATRSLLFLEIPTTWDRRHAVDPAHTDMDVFWRTGAWYRRVLSNQFRPIGGGLWVRHDAPVVFFELEAGRARPAEHDAPG